jgi:acetyltransferase-like isoleucine patch superfamily enzyme
MTNAIDRNSYISPKAKLGRNVTVGHNTTIYDHVEIGDDSVICSNASVGEPLSAYYHDDRYQNPPTVIGPGSTIRSHSVIYAGCEIGEGFSSGHHVLIRSDTIIGKHCSIGSLSDIEGEVTIGSHCRLHSNIHISQTSSIGDCVWMFPFSVITNDPYPPSHDIRGAHIGSYSLLCVHAIVLAGLRVGENCLVGANSVVNKNLPDFSLASGTPLKVLDIRNYAVVGKGKLYPWMTRFERGMPWEGIGYEAWAAGQLRSASCHGD